MSDLDRLRHEYAEREQRFVGDDRYSTSNVAYRFMKAQLQKHIMELLTRTHHADLASHRLLEIGCGNGNVLMDFHAFDVAYENLFGIDLLPLRLNQAHASYPLLSLTCSDGQYLPFPAHSFDVVMQFTAFSSILDDTIKRNVAVEMLRVVGKDGFLFWYDFWLNPVNPQTRGIRPAEIRRLFPNCRYHFQRITLAPPLARRLVPLSWSLASFLESLRIFNSHYLCVIQPIVPVK